MKQILLIALMRYLFPNQNVVKWLYMFDYEIINNQDSGRSAHPPTRVFIIHFLYPHNLTF